MADMYKYKMTNRIFDQTSSMIWAGYKTATHNSRQSAI